ncbi:MAG TPA: hypothetical protein VN446_07985 [Candidatus Acidoferrum sp.]|nr:hypothetical protein [Candidatus Acidoferrum sp.]
MTDAALNAIAGAYIDYALCNTKYDLWDMNWYAEGPFWRRTSMRYSREYKTIPDYEIGNTKHGKTLEDTRDGTAHLLKSLLVYKETAQPCEMPRVDYLLAHVFNLNFRTRMLMGERFSYDEVTRGLYGLTAPTYDFAKFDAAVREMGAALPGPEGDLEKIRHFLDKTRIPKDKLLKVMTELTKNFHDMTIERLPETPPYSLMRTRVKELPEGMVFLSLLFGYDYERVSYERNYNLNYDWTVEKAVECIGHECEPGHIYHFLKRTQSFIDTCFPEMSIFPQHCESSAFWEGSARRSIYMCFDNSMEKLAEFERDVVFEAAGLDKGLAGLMPLWHKFIDISNYGKLEASRKVWDGKWSQTEAAAFLEKYMFVEPGRGMAMVKGFANADAGHFVAHDYARDVVGDYFERETGGDVPAQWKLYEKLCTSHFSVPGMLDGTFHIDF